MTPGALARAQPDAGGRQVVEITVRGGYRPHVIRARAGVPLRIVFQRDDDDACSERVVFSAPRLDRRLAPAGMTTVDLPAQPAGEIRFTCGMGRYRGRIELVDGESRSIVAQLSERAALVEKPVGRALMLWVFSLPPVAILAVLGLDPPIALAAAGLALVAWVVGCLWAFSRSASPG
ncbi:MAG: cupredoxin domain-containing protein [Chloroflexi bacterium]|nr:cupredoxin domain-containing protein [Chloroflexota bacterium]